MATISSGSLVLISAAYNAPEIGPPDEYAGTAPGPGPGPGKRLGLEMEASIPGDLRLLGA